MVGAAATISGLEMKPVHEESSALNVRKAVHHRTPDLGQYLLDFIYIQSDNYVSTQGNKAEKEKHVSTSPNASRDGEYYSKAAAEPL